MFAKPVGPIDFILAWIVMNWAFLLRLAFFSFNLARVETDTSDDFKSAFNCAADELLAL
jgi:hypothetical protein